MGTSNYQVTLQWQLQKGLMINPRTRNPVHQTDDLAIAGQGYAGALTAEQMAQIDAIKSNRRARPVYKVCPDPLLIK
jgi:diketogulonate reductase-like aldo/keto reductase